MEIGMGIGWWICFLGRGLEEVGFLCFFFGRGLDVWMGRERGVVCGELLGLRAGWGRGGFVGVAAVLREELWGSMCEWI
jgi:hypothetical protein